MSAEVTIAQRLFVSDVRHLACRRDPDPRWLEGCSKVRCIVNGRYVYLCPLRVAAFLADAPSLAGIACQLPSDSDSQSLS